MNRLANLIQPIAPLFWLMTILLVILSASRAGLVAWQWTRVDASGQWLHVLFSGFRIDLMLLCQVMIFPTLALFLLPRPLLVSRFFKLLLVSWCLGWSLFILFMEAVTPPFMEFFETRPGRIFFEYLDRPGEIGSMILGGYFVEAVLALVVPLGLVALIFPSLSFDRTRFKYPLAYRLAILLPVLLLLALGARSTLGHRPVNPSTYAQSGDQLVNDLLLNSGYKLLYAIYSLRHEQTGETGYPEMAKADVLDAYRRFSGKEFEAPDSIRHRFTSPANGPRRNIVIIVEESLGARFVGSLGGLPLTPNLDAWRSKGLWLTNLYATGIRSARGLEAIVSGFPPSSARSVLKLGKAERNFYTLASSLKPLGYKSHFVYGGEGHFDNMKGFFLANDFDSAIDINDYTDYGFKGTWGVSDEDLFNRAHELMLAQDGPFFTLIFTSSFHSPYEYPDGKIERFDEEKQTKHNAVKYADYALGQYLKTASESAYWKDSIFLIVADHDERPRGMSLVPVESYHIPGLIIADGLTPREFKQTASQIDLLPTLLSLANVSGSAPFVGHDLLGLAENDPGRAVMQFGENHAYMEGNDVVIHQPGKEPAQYRYQAGSLSDAPLKEALGRKALVWALLPGILYRDELYSSQ